MEMTDFAKGSVWAIRAGAMESMLRRMPNPDAAASLAVRFKEDPDDDCDFMLRDGVAIIPVHGTIFKRGSLWSYLYGGSPLSTLNTVLTAAVDDRDVEAILLDMDSPGGSVTGTDAFTDLVYSAREKKPVVAFANGCMASAAYWIGSAANRVIVERTAQVGSIGVLHIHTEWSKYDASLGITTTVITSGKYKSIGNADEPLTDEARAVIQAEMDQIYDLFIETVARNRGVTADVVRRDMADGRIFIGQQAVDAGLADATGTFDDALAAAVDLIPAASGRFYYSSHFAGAAAPGKEPIMAEKIEMVAPKTADDLAALFPELCATIRQQGADGVDISASAQQAADDERARIIGLAGVHFGEEAAGVFAAIIKTGVTLEQYQAIRPEPVESEEAKALAKAKADTLAAIKKSGAGNPGAGEGDGGDKDFMAVVDDLVATKKITKIQAMQQVVRTHPKLHQAYVKQCNQVAAN